MAIHKTIKKNHKGWIDWVYLCNQACCITGSKSSYRWDKVTCKNCLRIRKPKYFCEKCKDKCDCHMFVGGSGKACPNCSQILKETKGCGADIENKGLPCGQPYFDGRIEYCEKCSQSMKTTEKKNG